MAINKVKLGEETLIDLTGDTVTEDDVQEGVTFHGADGEQKTGARSRTHADTHSTDGSDPITPESIGAAEAGHTHTPESIGAAEAGHTHDGYMSKTTYGGSADGVVKSADKLQTTRWIGNAPFDGTKSITASEMGVQERPAISARAPGAVATATAKNNHEEVLEGAVTSLTIEFTGYVYFNYWIQFTAGDTITVTFPDAATFIGGVPTFEPHKTYEMSIKNGCVVCAEVVSA